MWRSKILLRGLGGQTEIECSLRAILDSSVAHTLEVIEAEEPEGRDSGADLVIEFRDLARGPDLAEPHPPAFPPPCRDVPWLAVVRGGDAGDRLMLLEAGAADFLELPLEKTSVLPRVLRLVGRSSRVDDLVQKLKHKLGLSNLVGQSPSFVQVIKRLPMAAQCGANILITGETGTGKEMVARGVHYLSERSDRPFVPVSCGVVPVELAESELFGHEQGAFTGAVSRRCGLVQEANGGTLFLDDVDCLPPQVQTKMLRFLQEREYRLLGSTRVCRADVRVIAATNRDLLQMIKENAFREDLFYRLNVIPLNLPPLRERHEDVLLLARHFLSKNAAKFDCPARTLSEGAAQHLLLHPWPGNVRELQNVIERALVFSSGNSIQAADLNLSPGQDAELESFRVAKARAVAEFEKNYIEKLLEAHSGNISHAARAARKDRRAFWELMRKNDIDATHFKMDDRTKPGRHPKTT